jgi:lipopolysaccharide transport system ATP-binding protein
MDRTVISVRGLGKRYHLGGPRTHDTLRDSLSHAAKGLWRLVRRPAERPVEQPDESILWSLRNVSFDVADGEVVGLIGRNGSGKSTLLKVISQITEPTEGEVRVRGRVASLLEVGTGFHPELSGRENIFLNGAILGMTRAEIMRKFDEMVAFAEVEKFLDTPVKRYSSGMYVRLAFAVAAQLEPEILVVDEVLAVGDAAFRQKCMGKMNDIAKGGRTVLFVSHNLAAVSQLCQRTIWLNAGQIVTIGQSDDVIAAYISELQKSGRSSATWDREGTGRVRFKTISLLDARGDETDKIGMGDRVTLELKGENGQPSLNFSLWLGVFTSTGVGVLFAFDQDRLFSTTATGEFCIRVTFDRVDLMPGNYSFNIRMGTWRVETLDFVRAAAPFEVYQTAAIPVNAEIDHRNGLVYAHCGFEQVV